MNQVYLSIKWFLTKMKAQIRAVIYNELSLPVFIPLPFITGMCQF